MFFVKKSVTPDTSYYTYALHQLLLKPRAAAPIDDVYNTFALATSVLDAYGHLSVRHPSKPDVFIMSRQVAPALVSSPEDLVQYWVSDASPVDPSMAEGYVERYIHSEILKKYPDVNAVIHSHADPVIPYGITRVPLRACFHMAGFLGTSTPPIFDIAEYYAPDDIQDMLVRNIRLGKALAACFADSKSKSKSADHTVVLMRGHGMTVVAPNIEECVLRAIYTRQNATIQTTALVTRSAYSGLAPLPEIRYLSKTEAEGSAFMTHWSAGKPWKLWVREVEHVSLYVNDALDE